MYKFAFFDFDKTIISKDSQLSFFLFLYRNKLLKSMDLLKALFAALCYSIGIIDEQKSKQIAFQNIIKNNNIKKEYIINFLYSLEYHEDAIKTINSLKSDDYKIVVVSASCDIYMKYLPNILDIDNVICTEIVDGKVQENCKGKNKVKFIKEFINSENCHDVNLKAYGDSKNDIPMMDFCHEAYIINNKKLHNLHKDKKLLIWDKKIKLRN